MVLDRLHRLTDREICNAVERLLQADTLVIQNEQEVFAAMIALKTGASAFADALIGVLAHLAGCTVTVTFDKKAARLKGFEIL